MSSNPILFDSEEFNYEDKENKTNNDLSQDSNAKQVDQKNTEDDSLNKLIELGSIGKGDDQTQSSQEILDSIASDINNANKTLPTAFIPDSEPIQDSDSLQEDLQNNHEHLNESEPMEDSEIVDEANTTILNDSAVGDNDSANKKPNSEKQCSLPLSRVKLIMKTVPNVKVVSAEATVVAAIAAEKFLQFIVKETVRVTMSKKKKTMMKQHFDEAIQGLDVTEFLEGMMDDDL